jgi:hypothetical protein
VAVVALSLAACLDKVEPVGNGDVDAGTGQYVTWGSFIPGASTSDGAQDVSKLYGAPDGTALHLGIRGSVDVTFGDLLIYDRIGADFIVHGELSSGESATVFGSADGADYDVIGEINSSANTIEITRGGFDSLVYLRISDDGVGDGIEIDAIEVASP